jgi:hypothetical protein
MKKRLIKQDFISDETKELAIKKGLKVNEVIPNFWGPGPGWHQATIQKWLRDKHNLSVEVWSIGQIREITGFLWGWGVYTIDGLNAEVRGSGDCESYEDALEDGLKAALLLL